MRLGMVGLLMLAACFRPLQMNAREQCATDNMILESLSSSENDSRAVATDGTGLVTARASSSGTNVTCRRARTASEKCEVTAALASLEVKNQFETKERNQNLAIGYFLFLVPGIVLHSRYSDERDAAEKAAEEARQEALQVCTTENETD